METLETFLYACGHQFSMTKTSYFEGVTLPRMTVIYAKRKASPDQCPKCTANEREAKNKAEQRKEKNEEAVRSLKAHAAFLETQIAGVKHNPDLKPAFEKLLCDCQVKQSKKMMELAKDYQEKETDQEPHSQIFQRKMDQTLEIIEVMRETTETSLEPWSNAPAKFVQLNARKRQWVEVHDHYRELKKNYKESTKQGFEQAAIKLEELRKKAMELIKAE